MVAVIKHKIRVILADDHPVVRDGLAAMVNQQADMEVVAEAGDGDEAIALYEQHHPDVAIYTPVIDRELNAHKYIVPGLGDFGDRLYGTT